MKSEQYAYPKVAGKIKEFFGSQEKFAMEWGRAQRTVSMKLARKNEWTVRDIEELCMMLHIEKREIPEFFF